MKAKNHRLKIVLITIVTVICLIAVNNLFLGLKAKIQQRKEFAYRNEIINDGIFVETSNLESKTNQWYEKYSIIAHSGGGIDGKVYTNCLEAWMCSYENGTRVFDADLSLTSDYQLVLRHEWYDDFEQEGISEKNIPDYKTFMETPIFKEYTPMSGKDMLVFMQEYEDCYVACDFKEGIEGIKVLVDLAKNNSMESILDRVIISFYAYEDFYSINEIYNFTNWAVRQYENLPHNYYELAEFCVRNRIPVCMVKQKYLQEGDDISILINNGIKVWTAVVNNFEDIEYYKELGVSGFVSDFIHENDIRER